MGGAHSPPRRGGVARSAGVVSSAKRCAGLTTPAAPLRWLRGILLMAQPPLLCEEGNLTRPHSTLLSVQVRFHGRGLDLLQRNIGFTGDLRTIFVLGSGIHDFAVQL